MLRRFLLRRGGIIYALLRTRRSTAAMFQAITLFLRFLYAHSETDSVKIDVVCSRLRPFQPQPGIVSGAIPEYREIRKLRPLAASWS